jgi:hypothetical protein
VRIPFRSRELSSPIGTCRLRAMAWGHAAVDGSSDNAQGGPVALSSRPRGPGGLSIINRFSADPAGRTGSAQSGTSSTSPGFLRVESQRVVSEQVS